MRVAELAGVRLPVELVRRQRVVLWDAPAVPQDAPMTIDEDTTSHWRPVGPAGAYLLYPDPGERPAPPLDQVPPDPSLADRLLDPRSPVVAGPHRAVLAAMSGTAAASGRCRPASTR